MPIVKKDLDKMIPGHTPEFEAAELETDTSRDIVGPMGSAINSEEETIVFYRDLLDMFPDFAPVLKDIIAEEEKHIGQLEVLRNSSSSEMTKNIEKGVEEAEHQLETGSSEEPEDLGKAEVDVDSIAIEIPEDDEIEPVETPEEEPAEGETDAPGEIPTEGDFKKYGKDIKLSDYAQDILFEDTTKNKFVYEGPIYSNAGLVVQDGKEWIYADTKTEAIKKLINRLKKTFRSSYIHIEPQNVKEVSTESVNEDYDDDFYDDWEESNIYGGDMTYCPICDTKLTYSEDGDSYCPDCGESAFWLAQKRREMDKVDEDFEAASFGGFDDDEIAAMRDEQREKEAMAARKASNPEVKPGDRIRIIKMDGEPHYDGKEGEVDYIDSIGQIHGTWGGLAIVPEVDIYEIIVEESIDLDEDFEDLEESYIFKKLAVLPDAKEQMLDLLSLNTDVGEYFTQTEMLPVPRLVRAPWTILKQQHDGKLTDFNFDTDGSILIDYARDNGYENTEDLEYIISDTPRNTITYTVLKAIKNTAERLNKKVTASAARTANVEALLRENPTIAEELKAHITKIVYEIPMIEEYPPQGEADRADEEISQAACEKLEQIYYNFMNLPFADNAIDAGIVKHRDYTMDYNHNITSCWGGIGLITFDCKADTLSKKAQSIILQAKAKKEDDPSIKDTGNIISCYRLANALIKYYGNDVNFFNKPSTPPADTAATERKPALVASHEVAMDQDTLTEAFDLEDERDILLKAGDYKCKLSQQDIEEFIEPEGIIEDMKDIYQILCGKYDDVNIDYWCYTEDGIRVYFCNAKSGYLDIDDSDLI